MEPESEVHGGGGGRVLYFFFLFLLLLSSFFSATFILWICQKDLKRITIKKPSCPDPIPACIRLGITSIRLDEKI